MVVLAIAINLEYSIAASSVKDEDYSLDNDMGGHCDNNNVRKEPPEPQYMIIGVSGGLQDGFPERSKLNYVNNNVENVPAIFLGRGLVRGYKAYLDVMQPTWRQYVDPDEDLEEDYDDDGDKQQHQQRQQQLPVTINSNVIASGCYHHANEYWM